VNRPLFAYPPNSAFGQIVPKQKIYDRAKPAASLKELFVSQVERIIWAHKLAPETINIHSTDSVTEIQIFTLSLKNPQLKTEVLSCIDRAIPFPIIFELRYQQTYKVAAAYKYPNPGNKDNWKISDYFATDFFSSDTKRQPLPVCLNMESLYENLLRPLLPCPPLNNETLSDHIKRIELIAHKRHSLQKLHAQIKKEKQFNRQIGINAQIRALNKEIQSLLNES
jgi:hypothetical protein